MLGHVNTWPRSCVELKQQYAKDWLWQFNTGNVHVKKKTTDFLLTFVVMVAQLYDIILYSLL